MTKKKIIFNNNIDLFAGRYINKSIKVPNSPEYSEVNQRRQVLAEIFEQLLLYDRIVIKTDRNNLSLYFLIQEIGLNKIEELLEKDIINIALWTPVIASTSGTALSNNKIDHSTVFGKPPIIAGAYTKEDSDPENNVNTLFKYFSIQQERKRIFRKIAVSKYILPDNSIAGKSAELVIDAYKNNKLKSLDLAYTKAPDQLDHLERIKLLNVGHSILETTFLAQNDLLSNNQYPYFCLTNDSIKSIETALKVEANTSTILKMNNVASLKQLYLDGIIPFITVFHLRDKGVVKNYRDWIHDNSTSSDFSYITKQYLDEISGRNNFFDSNKGKFIKNIGMFSLGSGIGYVLGGVAGGMVGTAISKFGEFGLGLFDSYILDGLLKGWNPKMFVDEIEKESKKAM